MVLDFDKKWKNGQTIRIKFINGSNEVREKVKNNAQRWIDESRANINFDFVNDNEQVEVRIEFGKPTESLVGNELLNDDPETSNLTFREENASGLPEWKILHEFGHVLGLIHEIFNPAKPFNLNYKVLKDYYMGIEGYSEAEYYANVERFYKRNEVQFFDFDKDSIMMYHLPVNSTDDDLIYPQTGDLSKKDLESLRLAYPNSEPDIAAIESDTVNELEITDHSKEYLFKFIVKDVSNSEIEAKRTANCSIKISGDLETSLGIYKLETEGKRAGFYSYFSPAREEEASEQNYEYNKDLNMGEYLLRIHSSDLNASGIFKLNFNLIKNPDD